MQDSEKAYRFIDKMRMAMVFIIVMVICIMLFMMIFNGPAAVVEEPFKLSINSEINFINQDSIEAKKLFVIKDNAIVGLTSNAVNVLNLTLPDAIEGSAVSIDYKRLETFTNNINITLDRSRTDNESINILKEQKEEIDQSKRDFRTKGYILLGLMVVAFIFIIIAAMIGYNYPELTLAIDTCVYLMLTAGASIGLFIIYIL